MTHERPKPDFEGFARDVMSRWPDWCELDAGDTFDLAKRYHLIVPIPGGFNPDEHDDPDGFAEPGDDWFEINFVPGKP